jgi:DNA-binding beta-propeller fold protein YncE
MRPHKEVVMRHTLLAIAVCLPAIAAAQSSNAYRVTQTYNLGGDGGWDYIVPEPARHRIFIGRQDRVMVVDEKNGKLLGEVTGIHGAHGTAINERNGRGFATSGDDSSVVMFDSRTFNNLGRIHAAEDADAIIYDAASNFVFTFNGDAHSSTVIDAAAGKLVTNIELGGKPEYGVSAGNGKVYANLTDVSEVVEIDSKTLRVTRRWPTKGCNNPVAMAIDLVHQRLFSGCRSGVMAVSDYRTGKVVATLPIGAGTDGAGYDPSTGDAFASNADGTLTIIHEDSPNAYHVVQTLATMPGSRNLGVDPITHSVFLAGATFDTPAAGAAGAPRPRPRILSGSFVVLVVERR